MRRIGSKITIRFIGLVAGCFCFFVTQVTAQEKWDKEGEIEDVEIEIVRERQIALPKANRNFEKVPPRPAEPIKPEITYTFRNLSFAAPDYNSQIRPLRLKQEEIAKIYGNNVSVGIGNYASPYLEGWFNTKRDKNKFFGAHLYHRSFGKGPVDDKNSGSTNTQIKVFGDVYEEAVTAGGFFQYENTGGYFYGYTPGTEVKRDTVKQTYDVFTIGGNLSNTKPSDFNFDLGGTFSYLTDHYQAAESELGLKLNSNYAINDKTKILINGDYFLIARKDSLVDAKPRHLFKVKPAVQFSPIENLTLTIGGNAVLENDSIRSKSVHIYPNFSGQYILSKNINAYASLSGDIDKVSLHSLSAENFWVNSNIPIFHTNRSIELTTGLKGKLGRKIAFGTGFAAANLKDLYFYQNAATDRSKFDIVYDRGNTKRINLFGEIGYNRNDMVRLSLRGDYFGYSTDQQAEAWHRPTYRFSVNSSFNVYKKIIITAAFVGQGGMKALDNETAKVVKLDPAIDLNAKADYYLSKRASVFLKFENLLSNKYPIYLNYPVRGFQVMGGVSWSF